jgi:DNA-binding transcriptional LysR family regulator
MSISTRRIASCGLASALLLLALAGCEAPNPNVNTPTSGRLIVYVDDAYAPAVRVLADTFMHRSPNAKLEIRTVTARAAVQALLSAEVRDSSGADTAATTAIVIGRKLIGDEADAVKKGGFDAKEYVIAYDGIAIVVPNGSPLKNTRREHLERGLASPQGAALLDSVPSPASAPVRFLLPDQNSSLLPVIQSLLLHDSMVAAPARYFSTSDSLLAAVAAGDGVGLLGWTAAHRDSAHVRTLAIGFLDSTGTWHPPAPVHPTMLVTGAYPLKQPLVGYTFSSNNSLAVGFLAWLSKSQDAQYYLANHGMQPENVKIRIVMPEE